MNAAKIAAALGSSSRSGEWWRCVCPVHGSRTGRSAALALRDGQYGLIVHCHAGCSRKDVLAELSRRGLLDNRGRTVQRPDVANSADPGADMWDHQRRIVLARDIVSAALPAIGSPVECYLQARIPGLTTVSSAIGYIPMGDPYARRRQSGSRRPVMVATVEHVETGIIGAHRTWLTVDGSAKASLDPVRISTGPIKGGAVRLAPAAES